MTETAAEALKAEKLHCPFCGSRAWKDTQNGLRQLPNGDWRQHVWCINEECNILGPERDTEVEAIAAWNQRPDAGEVRTYREGVEASARVAEDCPVEGAHWRRDIAAAIRKLP